MIVTLLHLVGFDAGYMSQNLSIASQTIEFVKKVNLKREDVSYPETTRTKNIVEKESSLQVVEAVRGIRTYFNETYGFENATEDDFRSILY